MNTEEALDTAKKVYAVASAIREGRLQAPPNIQAQLAPLLDLPKGPTGLPNIAGVSEEMLDMARAFATAMNALDDEAPEPERPAAAMSLADSQCRLFAIFEDLFVAMTGASPDCVQSIDEIKERLTNVLIRGEGTTEARDHYNSVAEQLEDFYMRNASDTFVAARALGGVKSVAGGQKAFTRGSLTAARIAGLYCDTQLIPDPVYPFLAGKLNLNAMHLQLAIALYYILQLRPLIDARLPEPPVVVFPSFEEVLEEGDLKTMAGQASLMLKVVTPALGANINSVEELYEYASKHEDAFCRAVLRDRLFVPPGTPPGIQLTPQEAATLYLDGLRGLRASDVVEKMKRLPVGQLLMLGIQERLRPQYHLLENADELDAQPLLSQAAHWHYFELCAQADARKLVKDQLLTNDAFDVLRALQDDSLAWLANIPVEGLAELRRNREHAELREDLKKCTAQLMSAGRAELSAVTREVNHGLQVLIQRQQAALMEIERKYSPKMWGVAAGAAAAVAAGASLAFLPALAVMAGASAPLATALVAAGGGATAFLKERAGMVVEKRQTRKSLIGMLASARLKA